MVDEYTPDIIVGTESWLNPTISSSEIFSPYFEVFRRDRSDGYGGVFLACHNSYNWENLSLITSDSEVEAIACELQLKNNVLTIMAVYRPPNSDFTYLQSMCQLIEGVAHNNPTATIWIGGDLNLPNNYRLDN